MEASSMDLSTFSLEKQIAIIRKVDVLVSPGGGAAFAYMFLKPGAVALLHPYPNEVPSFYFLCSSIDYYQLEFARNCPGGFHIEKIVELTITGVSEAPRPVSSCVTRAHVSNCNATSGEWEEK